MTGTEFKFILSAFVLISFVQGLYWIWLWQLKEYRLDRLTAHYQDIGYVKFILAIIGYSAVKQNKTPKFTLKSLAIFLVSSAVLFFAFKGFVSGLKVSFINVFQLIGYYILNILVVTVTVTAVVYIFNFLSNIVKLAITALARWKISRYKNLIVIGITGSYGKSTVKEILSEILSKKYKVLKTPANNNTPLGISRLILGTLNSSHQVFVVEMGAYKRGEIKELCDIVKPKIGILTAINEQHLALFGSIENTIKTKFELIDSLPEDGTAILNVGDENIQIGMEERPEIKAKVKLYSVGAQSDYYASDVAASGQGIKFMLISGQKMQDFKINIIGEHNVSNAIASIIAAEKLGITFSESALIVQKNIQLPSALKVFIGPKGSTLIDDTYNSNPDGVLAALDYLALKKGKKIVIMSSLIELGSAAHEVHHRIGVKISSFVQEIFVLDNYYFDDIKNGACKIELDHIKKQQLPVTGFWVRVYRFMNAPINLYRPLIRAAGVDNNWHCNKNNDFIIRLESDREVVADELKKELKFGDTVLFIGRGSKKVLDLLVK